MFIQGHYYTPYSTDYTGPFEWGLFKTLIVFGMVFDNWMTSENLNSSWLFWAITYGETYFVIIFSILCVVASLRRVVIMMLCQKFSWMKSLISQHISSQKTKLLGFVTPNIMIKRPASQAVFLTTQTITIFCAAFKHCRSMLDIFSLELTLASNILSSQSNHIVFWCSEFTAKLCNIVFTLTQIL